MPPFPARREQGFRLNRKREGLRKKTGHELLLGGGRAPGGRHRERGEPMQELKRILIATDLSPASEPALQMAAALAIRMDAGLFVLHVVSEKELDGLARAHQPRHPVDLIYSELEASVREQYRQVVPDEVRRFLHAEVLVVPGDAATEIVRTAALKGSDMIVTGTHGRGGLRRILMGSVAERVLRTAPCPVLTVRPEELREAA